MEIESVFEEDSGLFLSFMDEIKGLKRADKGFLETYNQGLDKWNKLLTGLYDTSKLDEPLYTKHCFLVLVSRYLVKLHAGLKLEDIKANAVAGFLNVFPWLSWLTGLEADIVSALKDVKVPERDIFYKLYPRMLPHSTKHGSGEYYTPFGLASLMVEESFKPGMFALDPSCGSGTFLIEMTKVILSSGLSLDQKRSAIANLAGFDKNVLALFMTAINLELLLHGSNMGDAFPRLVLLDSLFPSPGSIDGVTTGKYDLVIGNPPWIVLGGVDNLDYKEKLKTLSEELGIYVGGKNASNLEISVLFLYRFVEQLKPDGWIFFILPNSIITGSQHDKARAFKGFSKIEVWRFSSQPFKIHSICMKAQRSTKPEPPSYEIPFYLIETSINGDEPSFSKRSVEMYEPFHIERDPRDLHVVSVKRIIPREKKKRLLPLGTSPYDELFYKGAQVFPRTIFFVDLLDDHRGAGGVLEVKPSEKVSAKKLGRWNFLPYEKSLVEEEYLFSIAKSTSLIPSMLLGYLDAFLPFETGVKDGVKQMIPVANLKTNAKAHFDRLEGVFKEKKKPGASHSSLLEIINYQGCLENPRQMAPLKVVHNGGGSIVKGAIVEGEKIIDYSMFYCPVDTKAEAYYLLGYLNSPSLTESVKLVGSTGYHGSLRNIVKHPWDFPWPLFSPENALHQELSQAGKELESKGKEIVQKRLKLQEGMLPIEMGISRISIQNALMNNGDFKKIMENIDELVLDILEKN